MSRRKPAAPLALCSALLLGACLSSAPALAGSDKGQGHGSAEHPGKGHKGQGHQPREQHPGGEHARPRIQQERQGGYDDRPDGHYHHDIFDRRASLGEVAAAGISAAMIHSLLGEQRSVLHVGAGQSLPPGIAKNLARGKPLPPGIAKQRVPDPLLHRLPRVDGYEWVRMGTTLILVGIATQVIEQVIEGVFD